MNGSKPWIIGVVLALIAFIGGFGTSVGVASGRSQVQDVQIQDLKVQLQRMEETRKTDFVSKDQFDESQRNIIEALHEIKDEVKNLNRRIERGR